MNNSLQDSDAITQATKWQARLSSDLVTDQQQLEFKQWLSAKPENQLTWQEINSFWLGLDTLSEADVLPPQLDQNEKIAFQTIHPQPPKISTLPKQKSTRPALAIAASLLLTVSLFYSQAEYWFADYKTAPGEQHTLQLADGSQIFLNTDTLLSVDYKDNQRQITLHQGEAYFDVASDKSRPFIVTTEAGRIRALGTEFDIKSRDDQVAVTVFEHAVRVSLNNGQIVENLQEGQQLFFDDKSINTPTIANLSRTQSWRDHRIVFQDKPLNEVIAELNHYRSGLIMILNSEIKALPVTGVFDTDDTNIALKTIEQSLPVTISKITEQLVFISAN